MRLITPQMNEDIQKQIELDRMKYRAAALFWVVTVIFILATIFEPVYSWLSFVRATAEAAMVGAIADWFAVTAIFQHPLGLKIPHTAIVPNRKDNIAEQFGRFVQDNFLTKEVIATKLHSINIARQAARWLSQPENSRQLAKHVAVALTAIIQVIRDEDVQPIIEQGVIDRVRSTRFSPLVANLLNLIVAGNKDRELLYGTLRLASHMIEENKAEIRAKISRETPWWTPRTFDTFLYYKLTTMLEETLDAVQSDPDHPLREKFKELVNEFVESLKTSPDVLAQEELLKEELLQHPAVQEFTASLWLDLKTNLLERSTSPDSRLGEPIQQGLIKFGEALLNDETMLAKTNRWLEEIARYLVTAYGHEVGQLITQTIQQWDIEATTHKIELNVGRDLQFIRINGTIVGGLVGLVIHTVYQVINFF
jgi:uncharacterized membrane-anchored protein YjiN (DUF445 family)